MLAIARCLMMRPRLIILDEPTEGIMPRLVSQIRREIYRINQSGVSILLSNKNVETALKLCPNVFLMEKALSSYSAPPTTSRLSPKSCVVILVCRNNFNRSQGGPDQTGNFHAAAFWNAHWRVGSGRHRQSHDYARMHSRKPPVRSSSGITAILPAQYRRGVCGTTRLPMAAWTLSPGWRIAGARPTATEDTESNRPAARASCANLIQRTNAESSSAQFHSGVMLAAIPIATELKTIYFSTGEATEATGAKATRFSFRTGTDTYSIAAASLPWCVESFGQGLDDHLRRLTPGGRARPRNPRSISSAPGGKVLNAIPVPLDAKDFVPYLRRYPPTPRCCCRLHRLAVGCVLYQARAWGSTRR